MLMSLSCCQGVLPHHCCEVGEDKGEGGEGERGVCCHHCQDEEEGKGALCIVFVVVIVMLLLLHVKERG